MEVLSLTEQLNGVHWGLSLGTEASNLKQVFCHRYTSVTTFQRWKGNSLPFCLRAFQSAQHDKINVTNCLYEWGFCVSMDGWMKNWNSWDTTLPVQVVEQFRKTYNLNKVITAALSPQFLDLASQWANETMQLKVKRFVSWVWITSR